MLFEVQSVILIKYYTNNFDEIIRHRQRTAITNLYVRILHSTLRLVKISMTLLLLSFSFRKYQVNQCFKFYKNARILFLIMSTEELLSKKQTKTLHIIDI